MEVVQKRVDELVPYENNPRLNDDSVKYVAESIKQFGFKVPIVVDKDNVIIAGHTRLKAALELGMEEVPCIVASDLTPEQVDAFRLADNKVGEFSTWDTDKLLEELAKLEEFDMGKLGFNGWLDDEEEEIEVHDDEFDAELPENPISRGGTYIS